MYKSLHTSSGKIREQTIEPRLNPIIILPAIINRWKLLPNDVINNKGESFSNPLFKNVYFYT